MYRSTEGERGGEDVPGRKKSRFKALKSRLFGRLKRKDTDGVMKPSQSASDVTAPEAARGGYDSEEDSPFPKGTLSSRALSHDSIFLADQAQSSSEPTRVLSQDNVHSNIKALQMKLQQQKFHLGPPPLLIPSKRHEDWGATSDDDGLPQSPPEMSFQDGERHTSSYKRNHSSLSLAGTGSEEEEQMSSQPSSRPLSPLSRPSLRSSSPSRADASSPPPDFSSPAQFTSSLDTSAARHKLAIKPRNQRPANKTKKMPSSVYRPRSESMHDLVQALAEEEEAGEGAGAPEEKSRLRSHSAQIGVGDRERLSFLELRGDRESSRSPPPQEEHAHTPDEEDRRPRASSALVISEGEDPEHTDPEPMPEDVQAEVPDIPPTAVLETTLPETTETAESVTSECSGDDEEREERQEEAEDLTQAHTHLDTTERNLLPNVIPSSWTMLYAQCVDDLEESVDDLEQCVDDLEESADDTEQSVDDPAGESSPTQEAESAPFGEKRNSLVSDLSPPAVSQADNLTRYQPVAAPRDSKPTSDPSHTVSLRRRAGSSAESDNEIPTHPEVVLRARATPAGQESQVLLDNERRRPNSGSFFISSARRRSKVVVRGEWIPNQEEVRKPLEPATRAPLNNKDMPEKQRGQLEEKTKEAAQRYQLAPEKRGSLRREIDTRAEEEKRGSLRREIDTRAEEEKRGSLRREIDARAEEEKRGSLRREMVPNTAYARAEEEKRGSLRREIDTRAEEEKRGSLRREIDTRAEEEKRGSLRREIDTRAEEEKRGSLRREIDARTDEEKTDEGSREANKFGRQRRTETAEEKRSAFGVTLRTTSLSLKYRSETAQSDAQLKRHSLEATCMRAISEDLAAQHTGGLQSPRDTASSATRAEAPNRTFGLRKNPSMASDSGPTDSSAEDLKRKDSASMTRLWDRASRSSLSSTEGLATAAALQKTPSTPAPPKLPARPSTLPPAPAPTSRVVPPAPAPTSRVVPSAPAPTSRVVPGRPISSLGAERSAVDRRCDWANTDDKKASLSRMNDGAPCGDSQTKNNSKPAGSADSSGSQSSSSPPLQQSARGQPSWMELAQRKSLAWNDQTDRRRSQLGRPT